jgi:RimJ/RimL family protein N-acetyltransferase
VLREWTPGDLPAMTGLFDDPEVAYRTPVASPFGLAAADAYLQMIQRARADGTRLHLAITVDGSRPCGEVLLNLAMNSIGYSVGAAFRGRSLARRAAALMTFYAHHALGMTQVRAQIEPDNHASIAVAEKIGYCLSDEGPEQVEDARRSYTLLTWIPELGQASAQADRCG